MRISLIILCLLFLASCTPRFYPPKVMPPDDYVYSEGFTRDSARMERNWWEFFGDTTLNRLVERALENNKDIAVAVSRVEEQRHTRTVNRAQYLPQIGVSVTAQANYNSAEGIVQTYSDQPTITWQTPLFGQLHNVNRQSKAAIASAEWAERGVRLSVAAEVATTYFTLLLYQSDLQIAERTVTLRSESAALTDSLFRHGMSDGLTLEQARGLVYTAQQDIPQYRRVLNQTYLSLGVLLGQMPEALDTTGMGTRLRTNRYPTQLPVGLPSELMKRRPDIMQAHYDMLQAAANAGIARSQRWPSLNLTAYIGEASDSFKGLFSGNPFTWEVLGFITQPLFAFKKLKRAEQVAMDKYMQAMLNYEKTVLAAFADVENYLTAINTYRDQIERYEALVESNTRVAVMTRALYDNGLSNYLNVIDAERNLYQAQMGLANLIAQQYISYIGLAAALGGGW